MPHLTGLCLKPLNHWEYLNKPPAMSTGFHTEQIHLSKFHFRTGVKYTDSMGAQKEQWEHRCLVIAYSLTWTRFDSGKCLTNVALLWKLVILIYSTCRVCKRQKRYSNVLLGNSIYQAQNGVCQLSAEVLPIDPKLSSVSLGDEHWNGIRNVTYGQYLLNNTM